MSWGTPKSHESRSVPIPRIVVDELAAQVQGKDRDDLVFTTTNGAPQRNRNARRAWFDAAAASIGVPGLTPHELRHTAASLAVSAGANVKAVQRMLGHTSAAMTLDRYADRLRRRPGRGCGPVGGGRTRGARTSCGPVAD